MKITNLILRPGRNEARFTASVDQTKVVSMLQSDKYCKTQVIPFELECQKVVNNGQDIDYFRDALKYNRQTVDMEIGAIVKQSLGASLGCSSDN